MGSHDFEIIRHCERKRRSKGPQSLILRQEMGWEFEIRVGEGVSEVHAAVSCNLTVPEWPSFLEDGPHKAHKYFDTSTVLSSRPSDWRTRRSGVLERSCSS